MKTINRTKGNSLAVAPLILLMMVVGTGCKDDSTEGPDTSIPKFSGAALNVGALLCVTGPFSAKASTIEMAAILAEEYINGSTRAYSPEILKNWSNEDTEVTEAPCRTEEMCGAWTEGTVDAPVRGPLKLLLGDSEQRPDRAAKAAQAMVDDKASIIVGPCDSAVMENVFTEVTKTDVTLVTPIATADSVTDLDDRTAAEKNTDPTKRKPGWVYRTISPDYVQAQVLGFLATNLNKPPLLIRYEDQTDEDCTTDGKDLCKENHPDETGWDCLPSASAEEEERDFYEYSETECTGQPECDDLGKNYACVPPESGGGNTVCARYRIKAYCTKIVKPKTAMVLYPDTPGGKTLKAEVEKYWVEGKENTMLSTSSFDPLDLASYSAVIQKMFTDAEAKGKELVGTGDLPEEYKLEDSVVFLLADETTGALLLQEWQTQIASLPEGSAKVFWLGTSAMRTNTFLDLLGFDTVRNLYLTDPYTTDSNNREFFEELFRQRWQREAGDFAGTVFDSILLAVAASERARARAGGAEITAADVKNSLSVVSAGCDVIELPTNCSPSPETFHPQDFSGALKALQEGTEIRLHGVSGDLSLSPEGDRMTEFKIWKVIKTKGDNKGYKVWQANFTPGTKGITLRE